MDNNIINKIEKQLNYVFVNKENLIVAFTHSSIGNIMKIECNERLEFLGDSIMNFVVGEHLYSNTKEREGSLSKERARLVSSENLSNLIDELNIIEYYNIQNLTGDISKSIKCDLFEAIVGAIYVDAGLEIVKDFLNRTLFLKSKNAQIPNNYKTVLQEYLQQTNGTKIEYKVLSVSGKPHNPCYEIGLYLNGELKAKSTSKQKKIAENETAKTLLKKLKEN